MGLRVRKSISIGKGVRLNFGKTGVGVSFGGRGMRYSIHSSGRKTATVGIPGSGISYSITSGGKSTRRYSSTAYNRRAELQEKKRLQKLQQLEQNKLEVEEYNNYIEVIRGVHKECDDFVDWQHINSIKPPYIPPQPGHNKARAIREYEEYTPNFLEKIFKSMGENKKKKLEAAIAEAGAKDIQEYEEWKNLNILSRRILEGDIEAYLQVIGEMNPLEDLLEFGSDFEFGTDDSTAIEVEFRVKSDTVVPKQVLTLTQTGRLSRKDMTKTKYYEIVQDYVCSCALRIARDMTALLPINKVIVHAVDTMLNTATGHIEDITILSAAFDKRTLSSLNFNLIDPSDALKNFRHNMKFQKTGGFKEVERISRY